MPHLPRSALATVQSRTRSTLPKTLTQKTKLMIIELDGPPISKQRHRSFIRNGHIATYDPQEDMKNHVRLAIQRKMRQSIENPDQKISQDALSLYSHTSFDVELNFFIQPPASLSKNALSLLLWTGSPSQKPDVDNLAKFYLDVGNGILWADDKQIISLKVTKDYSHRPRTRIKIFGKKPMVLNEKSLGILGVFTPDRFQELLEDLFTLFQNQKEDNQSHPGHDPRTVDSIRHKKAIQASLILSKIADKYADDLKKIKKSYPGYWQEQQ